MKNLVPCGHRYCESYRGCDLLFPLSTPIWGSRFPTLFLAATPQSRVWESVKPLSTRSSFRRLSLFRNAGGFAILIMVRAVFGKKLSRRRSLRGKESLGAAASRRSHLSSSRPHFWGSLGEPPPLNHGLFGNTSEFLKLVLVFKPFPMLFLIPTGFKDGFQLLSTIWELL